ncbi:hypothetical protein GNI_077970 [Gregarina niphandrodes]|uniref:Uncharacterized protein n=1 Tax=Gregarina niphandrodes TaxID=110365 RepID=A0A023B6P8_GRENI|nr:hypothetical protein GNI_077970 [Gregarina niphandrodes]EZG66647.1 hypothetical protein GNI_077970 [Gregarina niphandrodes]|eukprot:XP_011130541.1 hypothetical protein GNI_077970 [Gregarina niphandrodes]
MLLTRPPTHLHTPVTRLLTGTIFGAPAVDHYDRARRVGPQASADARVCESRGVVVKTILRVTLQTVDPWAADETERVCASGLGFGSCRAAAAFDHAALAVTRTRAEGCTFALV